MTPEKEAAAARLRDYATIQDPASDPAAVRLAGERLDDFQTAHLPPGSMPRDPILGADPQRRAMVRQEWQQQLEQGSPWMPPMTPDEATSWMNEQEAKARVEAMATVVKALEDQGMSQGAATDVVDAMSRGLSLSDLAASAGPLSELSQVDGALSDGRHSLPWERYSTADLKALAGVGKSFWVAGTVAEIAVAYDAYANGAAPGKTLGGLTGNLGGGGAGGWALGLAGGSVLGPGGAFVGAVVGGLLGSTGGQWAGSRVGSNFDNSLAAFGAALDGGGLTIAHVAASLDRCGRGVDFPWNRYCYISQQHSCRTTPLLDMLVARNFSHGLRLCRPWVEFGRVGFGSRLDRSPDRRLLPHLPPEDWRSDIRLHDRI